MIPGTLPSQARHRLTTPTDRSRASMECHRGVHHDATVEHTCREYLPRHATPCDVTDHRDVAARVGWLLAWSCLACGRIEVA